MSASPNESAPVSAPPPHAQVIEMAFASIVSRMLFVVAELGIADHLKDGPKSADQIAAATDAHPRATYRVLRSSAALGLFVEDDARCFSLTPLGAALVSGAPGHARSTVRAISGPMFWRGLGEFLHSVKTGENGMQKAYGCSIFEYLAREPQHGAHFNEAMIGIHGAEPAAVAAAYDFSGLRTLVDVGGGTGNLLTTILQANPQLRGVLFDAPSVAAQATQLAAERGLTDRYEVVAGSFFDGLPSGGDAYILSHIIHDWDDDRCARILENCRRAMNPDGRLLIIEMVLPPGNVPHPGKMLDMVMLAFTEGGTERTPDEYAALLANAGFEMTRIVPTASPVSVVEGVPRG